MKLLSISLYISLAVHTITHAKTIQSIGLVQNKQYANFLLQSDESLDVSHTFNTQTGTVTLTCNDVTIRNETYASLQKTLETLEQLHFITKYSATYTEQTLTIAMTTAQPDDTVVRVHGETGKRCMVEFVSAAFIKHNHNKHHKKTRIILDPGHGGHDPGASYEYVNEKEIALAIAQKVYTKLEQAGHTVFMTRNDDTFIELAKRTAIATEYNADLFISIHLNATRLPEFLSHGIEVYHPSPELAEPATYYTKRKTTAARTLSQAKNYFATIQSRSVQLATILQNNLIKYTKTATYQAHNRGVKQDTFKIFWQALFPTVLIEAGFLSNSIERKLLQDQNHQQRIANGIFKSISEFI